MRKDVIYKNVLQLFGMCNFLYTSRSHIQKCFIMKVNMVCFTLALSSTPAVSKLFWLSWWKCRGVCYSKCDMARTVIDYYKWWNNKLISGATHQHRAETDNLRGLFLCCWIGTTGPITALSPWNCTGEFLACSVSCGESRSLSAANGLLRPLTPRPPELPVPPEKPTCSGTPLLIQLKKRTLEWASCSERQEKQDKSTWDWEKLFQKYH